MAFFATGVSLDSVLALLASGAGVISASLALRRIPRLLGGIGGCGKLSSAFVSKILIFVFTGDEESSALSGFSPLSRANIVFSRMPNTTINNC